MCYNKYNYYFALWALRGGNMARIQYPECGKIVNTHGCHGGVKIESWCDTPAVLAALPVVYVKKGGELVPYAVRRAAISRNMVFADLAGISTMEQADAMRNTVLYANRDDLKIPGGVFLIAELIGLPVYHHESGVQLGTLKDVIHPGASDVYVITTAVGEAMVPVVAEFVKRVDESGIYLAPIEGMFAQ
jgi:16S rRNA processing protein RimM